MPETKLDPMTKDLADKAKEEMLHTVLRVAGLHPDKNQMSLVIELAVFDMFARKMAVKFVTLPTDQRHTAIYKAMSLFSTVVCDISDEIVASLAKGDIDMSGAIAMAEKYLK